MTIDDQIEDKKLQYDIKKAAKYQHYYQTKLISMNTLQAKKYYLPIKKNIIEQGKFEKLLKNKQKPQKIKEKTS